MSYFSRKCWDFLCLFFIFYFSVPYFGLACDHGNSFLCLGMKGKKEKVLDRALEVRTVINVKTITTTTATTF